MCAVFYKSGPRRVRLKENDQNTCARFGDDAEKGYNTNWIHSVFFASGGDHVGFFPAQNEHEKLDAICVIGIFCVITDKT